MPNPKTETHSKIRPNYVNILGVRVSSTPKEDLLKGIAQKLGQKRQFQIVTPNPEIILASQEDKELKKILNNADFAIGDGVGLRLANHEIPIIKGRNLMLDLFQIANNRHLKVYLISKKSVIDKALNILISQYPNIAAEGSSGPWLDTNANPVSKVDTSLEIDMVKKINNFKPDLIFVGFGAPKQEKWIAKWLPKLKATGAIGVGGSLDYFAGVVKPVPIIFEKLGLEWLWRVIQEPTRIGRIFNALIVFPLKVIFADHQ